MATVTYWRELRREAETAVLDPNLSYCRRTLERSTVYPETNKKTNLRSQMVYFLSFTAQYK